MPPKYRSSTSSFVSFLFRLSWSLISAFPLLWCWMFHFVSCLPPPHQPRTRKQEFFVYCECELQYCKEVDVVGILLRMEQQRHRRRGGRMAALSEKNLRTLLGFFLGCFVTMNLNLHSLVDLELSSTSSDALGPIGEAEKERTRRLRRPYSASLQQQQPQPQQHTSSNTSPLAGIRILVAITSFCV